jgi:outer membrane protein TolC
VLPVARRAFEIAFSSYKLGGSSSLEVLDTRRTLLDAENQYTDALAAANSARADLDRATATSLAQFQTGDSHDR